MKECMKKMNLNVFVVIVCSFLSIGLSSCNKDDDNDVVAPAEISYVSLYHASPDASAIDVFLDERRVNYNPLRYTNFTSYLNFYAGERQMRVRPANAANVIIDTTFTFMKDQAYSLFYVNRLANIEALLVKDSLVAPTVGQAAVRFIHLSPDAPAVDVMEMDESGTSLFANQSYLQASDFKMIESGVQSFTITVAGGSAPVLSIPDVNLVSGGVYTIIARGLVFPPAGNENNLSVQIILNN